MNDALSSLDAVVSQLIAGHDSPTEDSIRETISAIRISPMFADITEEQAELLARQIEERIGISMGIGAIVSDADFKPWLNDAKAENRIDPYYWNRYRQLPPEETAAP